MSSVRHLLHRSLPAVIVAIACTLATFTAPAPAEAAPRDTAAVRLRHRDGVLQVRLLRFPAQRRGHVRMRVGKRVVVKRVKTNRRGGAVVRFRVAKRRKNVRVAAKLAPESQLVVWAKKPVKEPKGKPTTTSPDSTTDTTSPDSTTDTTTPPPDTTTDTTPTGTSTTTGPFGPDPAYAPTGDVNVGVGQLTQQLLDGHPTGTRFVIAAGVHRLSSVLRPRAGQQLLGMPGAVLNGSKVVTSFTQRDGLWVSGGHANRYTTHGHCVAGYDACGRTEAVYVGETPLWQVSTLAELRPGTFLFDRTAGELVLYDDPTGKHIELAVASAAVAGRRPDGSHAAGVVVRNLVITKFATMAQRGAVDSEYASGWTVERNTVSLNGGGGVIGDSFSVMRGNRIVRNGQLGAGGHGDGGLVEGNEIGHNHTNGFSSGWEAGGTKWSRTRDLVVRGNYVHSNDGPGLWTDIDNLRTTYADNVVTDNAEAGIFHEISYDAVITGNTALRNGFRNPRWGYGAGIQISASGNVTVANNVVENNARGITLIQQNRGTGTYGPYEVSNVDVRNNTIVMQTGFSGLVQDVGDLSYFSTRNNRFSGNTYRVGAGLSRPFEWRNGMRTITEWSTYHPLDGPFTTG